jgi:hypothetical protein
MATVQWRPEVNALTTPPSYTVRYMARDVLGYDELAAEIARNNPLWDKDMIKSVLIARDKTIMQQLINGNRVTLPDAFSYRLSFNARLNEPDDPLPSVDKMLKVRVSPSRTFVKAVAQEARLERLPAEEKLPLINAAEDTLLQLSNVLNPQGVLRLTGSNLSFDVASPDCGCVLEGTRSGRTVQTQFASVANSEILVVPHIPVQADLWNNEYALSVSTRYTENGTLRTGIYRRKLRSPLLVSGFGNPAMAVGILTGGAATPYVTITGGALTADETLRIQAAFDTADNRLLLSLLDLRENGAAGEAVAVAENGNYTLLGFANSAVSSLNITVHKYTKLTELVRNNYAGWLADVLELKV